MEKTPGKRHRPKPNTQIKEDLPTKKEIDLITSVDKKASQLETQITGIINKQMIKTKIIEKEKVIERVVEKVVEKVVEVERVVEKIIEKEKIVEKRVEVPTKAQAPAQPPKKDPTDEAISGISIVK